MHDLLGSENLNCPRNAMMLLSTVHVFFGTLQLWLTPFKVDLVSSFCATDLPQYLGYRMLAETLFPTSTRSISAVMSGMISSAMMQLSDPSSSRTAERLNLLHLNFSLSTLLAPRWSICPVL